LKQRKIAFIGGGHITKIIVENLIRTETAMPEHLIVSDPNKGRLETLQSNYGIVAAKNNLDAVDKGDFIFINVLPQVVDEVIKEFEQLTISANKVLITLAAGISIKKYSVLGMKHHFDMKATGQKGLYIRKIEIIYMIERSDTTNPQSKICNLQSEICNLQSLGRFPFSK
jgi:glycerol-3-phosphate dehydrogenase